MSLTGLGKVVSDHLVIMARVYLGNRDRKNVVLLKWCSAQNTAE